MTDPQKTPKKTIEQLSALAQDTRFAVFQALMRAGQDGLSAGAIAKALNVAPNALSNHLAILTRADLTSVTRQGRNMIYMARIEGVKDLLGALVDDCCNGHPEMCVSISGLPDIAC
ncbi:MAG: transcriptional regulator [Alphaproteobacteria bacterium]|nr:MAG: transcriptional regulator [Alphaproteobacteria bacterium]